MRSAIAKAFTLLFLAAGGIALASGSASADVVSPPGACSATGDFTHAKLTVHSSAYAPSDVIVVPQVDVVQWSAHEHDKPIGYVGEKRPIAGAVRLVLPGSFDVSIWSWAEATSTRYSNAGAESYRLPSILIGVKLKFTGFEEDAGRTVCSGSVFVEVEGSKFANPLGWVALAGSALFLLGLVVAGFRKVSPPSDDLGT
jgi:hypothetical protein